MRLMHYFLLLDALGKVLWSKMFNVKIFICLFACVAIIAACRGGIDIPTEFPTPPPVPNATPAAKIVLKPDVELEKQIAEIAKEAKGKVGVAAVLLETGDSAMLNGDQQFPMQSVYKLPISMAVMEQVRLGKLELDEKIGVTRDDFVRPGMRSPLRDANPNGGEFTIRELIRLALVESDGTASDVLMRIAGGADEIQYYLTQIGINDMKVVNTEKELGMDWETQYKNWATPTGSIELLRWLWISHRAEGSDRRETKDISKNCLTGYNMIFCDMAASTTGLNRLAGLVTRVRLRDWPPTVAHKTGTSGTRDNITAATNDIGLISRGGDGIAIAVFVSDSPADEKTREAVIAKIAKAVWDRWGQK